MNLTINKLKSVMLYAGLSKDEYDHLKSIRIGLNHESLKILSKLTIISMLIMIIISYHRSIWISDRPYYYTCLCISTGIVVILHLELIKSEVFTLIISYLYLGTMFFFGISIGNAQPSMTSVSFLIYIMVGPLLFYDRPIKINIFIWLFNILFLFNTIATKEIVARDTDIVNAVFYGLISSFLNTHALIFKIKRVWLESQIRIMAETDALTNLKNQNCFNRHYWDYLKKAKQNVTCIYLDANGLHELNNSKGHNAGDAMLKYIAKQTVILFGSEDTYRIGGDEYVIICCDIDIEIIKKKTKELSELLKEKNYSVSVGIANAPIKDLDMDELIKEADEAMYLAKEKHYAKNSTNIRKNRADSI